MDRVWDDAQVMRQVGQCKLFARIAEKELPDALGFLHARIGRYEKDALLLRLGEPFLYAGVVLSGMVEGSFISENYNKINMNHFAAGRSFGEALACVQARRSPVQMKALTDCTVLYLDLHALLTADALDMRYQQILSANLARTLAEQNIFSNLKLRIASQKGIRDRVRMYLSTLEPDGEGLVHIPFTQTALAEFLGVNRSALSREIGKMRAEGLLVMEGKRMRLVQK